MKTFSKFLNESVASDKQPGNNLQNTGVTNHYTPIENILTNIRNLFCTRLGVVADVAEDNVSIKLHSTKFVNDESIQGVLYEPIDRFTSLASYIQQQGLTKMSKINLGMYYVVYFSPEDINTAEEPATMEPNAKTISTSDSNGQTWTPVDFDESQLSEFEISSIINEDDGEEEMKSETVEKVLELIDGPDKVKAAKKLEQLVLKEIELPREYYFSAIKFKTGEEAIALRWKYTKKMPFGKEEGSDKYKDVSVENTRSIMHIFGKGEKAIWVQDFAEDSIVELPEEVKTLIESILDLLEAGKTDDSAIFSLTGERKEREDKEKDKEEDDSDKKDEKSDEKSDEKKDEKDSDDSPNDDEDDEDDDSRGDDSDNLL